jgi:hypothetical protein
LLDGCHFWVEVQFMLNQFPRNSKHITRLPCKDIPIFLKEFDKCVFLFGVQTIAYVSDLRRHLRGQWDCLAH